MPTGTPNSAAPRRRPAETAGLHSPGPATRCRDPLLPTKGRPEHPRSRRPEPREDPQRGCAAPGRKDLAPRAVNRPHGRTVGLAPSEGNVPGGGGSAALGWRSARQAQSGHGAPRGPTGPPWRPCRRPPQRLRVPCPGTAPTPEDLPLRSGTAVTPALPTCSQDEAGEARLPGLGPRVTHSLPSTYAPRGRQGTQSGRRFRGTDGPRGPLWTPGPKPRGCRRARGQGLGAKEIQVVNTPVPRGVWPTRRRACTANCALPNTPRPPPHQHTQILRGFLGADTCEDKRHEPPFKHALGVPVVDLGGCLGTRVEEEKA